MFLFRAPPRQKVVFNIEAQSQPCLENIGKALLCHVVKAAIQTQRTPDSALFVVGCCL